MGVDKTQYNYLRPISPTRCGFILLTATVYKSVILISYDKGGVVELRGKPLAHSSNNLHWQPGFSSALVLQGFLERLANLKVAIVRAANRSAEGCADA